ncbi:hypothetical protein OS493_023624 [Desmophyllum pertusum]|uniref:Uncharacterized protein n=1 Tax=Desmophyllum pertusum TaxID=174260 RepID=A0A9W9ZDU8_9CNID|nr:hypothetical protein OS493_023624 [Desmophyllum pertusum]
MKTQVKPVDNISHAELNSKWKAFASSTTLHGLRYVAENGHSISRRVIWLMFLCTVASVYVYFVSISVHKYISRPVKTIVSDETPMDGLTFPAVTICNLNKFMKSKIDVADEDENFEKMGLNISGCSEIRDVRGNLTCGQAMLCAYGSFGTALVKGCNKTTRQNIIDVFNRSSERLYNEEEFLTKYGHDMASITTSFLYCSFMENIICSDEDFVPAVTEDGICFTFNSGHNGSVLRSLLEGPDLGLSILLDIQTNESTLGQFSSGLKVIVHDQKTFVNRHNGFNIGPGTHATVAVKLRKHIRLPAPFQSKCRQEELPGIDTYTKDGCIYQCIGNTTLTQCGCRRAGLPDTKGAPLCSVQDKECVDYSRKQVNLSACSCSNACSELEYESRVSYSKFPDNSIIKMLHHLYDKKESSSYMKENYVFLQVGFQHLACEKREDVSGYGMESLLGEFGGNMGLFLGCSILTLCEFIDFLWEAVMTRIRKRSLDITSSPDSNS